MSENGKTTSSPKVRSVNGLADSAPKSGERKSQRPVLKRKARGGAPKGNSNAWKSGFYTEEHKDLRRRVRAFRHHVDAVLASIKAAQLSPHSAEEGKC